MKLLAQAVENESLKCWDLVSGYVSNVIVNEENHLQNTSYVFGSLDLVSLGEVANIMWWNSQLPTHWITGGGGGSIN